MNKRKIHKILNKVSRSQKLALGLVIVLVAGAGVYTLLFSHAAEVAGMTLSLSPTSQTVTIGSDITVNVTMNTSGASINTVQSVLNYSPTAFSLVSITPGTSFGSFPNTPSSGSIEFTAGATTPVSGSQVLVATVVLKSIGTATGSSVSLASVCPSGSFAITCSAVYDSTTSDNDLSTTTNPITNASYTVSPILPTAPTGVVSPSDTPYAIDLSWAASSPNGGPAITGYYIFRNGTQVGWSTGTTFTNTGLTPGTSYSYTITAYNAAGNSSLPSTALAQSTEPLPAAPTNVTDSASVTSIDLSWTASSDTGGPGIASYNIYRNSSVSPIGSSTTASYTDSGLTANTSYSYTIKAVDKDGNVSAAYSTAINAKTAALPAAPTAVKSTGATTTSIILSWTASGSSGVTGYYIYRGGTEIGSSTSNSYMDSGLTPGTSYSYTVVAHDSATMPDVSSPSTAFSVTTPTINGDLDADGHVTGHDLSIFLSHYGANYPLAEFDGGSTVEGHDLSILLSNYGK